MSLMMHHEPLWLRLLVVDRVFIPTLMALQALYKRVLGLLEMMVHIQQMVIMLFVLVNMIDMLFRFCFLALLGLVRLQLG